MQKAVLIYGPNGKLLRIPTRECKPVQSATQPPVPSAANVPSLDPETGRALAWALQQRRAVTFSAPTSMPGEPPINHAQREELRALDVNPDDPQLEGIGTWQAQAVIDRVRQEKDQFSRDLAQEWLKGRNAGHGGMGLLGMIAGILAALLGFGNWTTSRHG